MVAQRAFRPSRAGSPRDGWTLVTLVLVLLLVGPFVALLHTMTGDSDGLWPHLMATVFPRYVVNTVLLMLGVGLLTLGFGLSTAWVLTRYRFPGSRWMEWALLLPATVPGYLIAYTYTDLLEFAGPVQTFLRDQFAWRSARDYWFPEIRSMGGAIVVMGSVLYPYVYLMARTGLRVIPAAYYEVALNHNRSLLLAVGLPIARPAIVAGLALVLMETISDFGTVEYFAVETLTLGIFNVWLGMNNLTAAAQIAGMAFVFILALLYIEQAARKRQRFSDQTKRSASLAPIQLRARPAWWCISLCLAPIILGFVIPVGVLLGFVIKGFAVIDYVSIGQYTINSVAIAITAAIVVMGTAFVMVTVVSYRKHPWLGSLTTMASMGYAFPGTVLAIGVVAFAGAVDGTWQWLIEDQLGLSADGALIGSISLLIFAYVVRFQAIGYGAASSGIKRLSPNIMNASFVLGHSFTASLLRVASPLLYKPLLAGGMLVFVDVMKELPMTLLLRPFNFETLATYVYQFAKDELLEQSALAALVIVAAGIGPIVLMNASQRPIR